MPTAICCRCATRRRRRKPRLHVPPSYPSGLWVAGGMQAATALAPFSDQLVTEIPMLQPHPAAVVAVIGLLPFVLAACSDAASSLRDPRTQPPLVRTEAVERSVQSERAFTGIVAARVQSDLGFRVPGKLLERRVHAGQTVNRGQPLSLNNRADLSASRLAHKTPVV